jgi:hypothetical protein
LEALSRYFCQKSEKLISSAIAGAASPMISGFEQLKDPKIPVKVSSKPINHILNFNVFTVKQ